MSKGGRIAKRFAKTTKIDGVIAWVNCPLEQKCHAEWGFQPLKTDKKASVLPLSASKKANSSPTPLVHPAKPLVSRPFIAPL
jgi:hypothetical protein